MSHDRSSSLPQSLTPAERCCLLQLARESIRTAFGGAEPPTPAQPSPALAAPSAAFVSLHEGPQLRGCVGSISADRPLHQAVVRMARSAAFDDPRFPPLAAAELDRVAIQISRLGILEPAVPEQVRPGHHGVCVRHGLQRAVFLPQVASMHHWDRVTLLRQLCLKAMLPEDAWRHPDVTLMVFDAEVFSDEDRE